MPVRIKDTLITLALGDITREETDAIVNAANSRLAGGGGVDGAIHRAGGPAIMEECRRVGRCPTGSAVMTTGGNLKAKYVIHAVGPIYRDGMHNEAGLLTSAYESSLKLAKEKGLKSIAFPSISTGAYGYPLSGAARIALKTVVKFLKAGSGLTLVKFILFSSEALEAYSQALKELTGRV
ncbi:MAG: O-acetyl-ADP-ribose deacetylase [Deltaproteobacteria bacterium]|nr:O-acetyl-ADP-ribose deacetylase [Deltaproteobacteria bacterium]